jgi:CheY-like chemotaxis protein
MGKILIVDDDRATRLLIGKIVEGLGYCTLGCLHGAHALETLEANEDIALVITDMAMPTMDGRQLIRELQQRDRWRKIPVLIMSAVVGVKEVSDLLTQGARAFLRKPVHAEEIRDYVDRYLGSPGKK